MASQIITYTVNVTVTRPIAYDNEDATAAEQLEWRCGSEAKRELEREVIQALRKLDGDCDVEVIYHAISEE